MPVVRRNQSTPAMKEAIVLDFGDIGAQAAKLRQAAENRAAEILRKAERQAAELLRNAEEQGVEAGYQDGLERGYADGLEKGREEAFQKAAEQIAAVEEAWLDLSGRWESQLGDLITQAREGLLAFGLRFAERLVHRVIEVDEEVVVDQLAEVLGHILRPLDVHVRINPEDRPVLEKAMPDLLARFNQLQHVELTDDPQVTRGGCIARFGHGQIDATIDRQVERMVEAILPPLHTGDTPVVSSPPAPSRTDPATPPKTDPVRGQDGPAEADQDPAS